MAALTLRSENQNESGQLDGRYIRRVQLLLFRRRNGGPKEGLLEINRIKLGDGYFLCITITIKWTAGQFACICETVNGLSKVHMEIDNIELRRFKEVREEPVQGGYVYDGGTVAVPDVRYEDLDNESIYQYTTVGLDRNFVTILHDELSRMYGLEDNGRDLLQPFPGRIVKYLGSFYVVVAATEENLILHVLEESTYEFQAFNLRQVRKRDVEELGEFERALDQRRKEEVLKLMKALVVDPLDPQYAQAIQVSE